MYTFLKESSIGNCYRNKTPSFDNIYDIIGHHKILKNSRLFNIPRKKSKYGTLKQSYAMKAKNSILGV